MKKHLDLAIGAAARLAYLKAYAEKHNAKHGGANPGHTIDWRKARYATFKSDTGLDQGFNGDNERTRTPVWYAHGAPVLSRVLFADECDDAPNHVRNNRGWYSDADCSETVRGVIAKLPHDRRIAGYYCSDNEEYVWFPEVFYNSRDAARHADKMAEREAEEQKQISERQVEAEKLEGKIEDALQRVRELIVLRHVECMSYVRDELRETIASIQKWRETLRTDYADVL